MINVVEIPMMAQQYGCNKCDNDLFHLAKHNGRFIIVCIKCANGMILSKDDSTKE